MEGCWVVQLQYTTGICLEILRKMTMESVRIFGVQYEIKYRSFLVLVRKHNVSRKHYALN
jgi:hypothetical protein